VSSAWSPERGDIVWIVLTPHAGREEAGRRPAVVVSPASYNGRVGLALMCPVTTVAKGYPFEVAVPPDVGVQGVVLADQVKSLDWRARGAVHAGRLPPETVLEVLHRVRALLDIR
jgi:mRNA interferase MazF